MKQRSELILLLQDILQQDVKHDKRKIHTIKENLANYQVTGGQVVTLINDAATVLDTIDPRLLCLFAEQVLMFQTDHNVQLETYFTQREIKEAHTTYLAPKQTKLEFPFTFENVLQVSEDEYVAVVTCNLLKNLYDSGLIQYNHETQREARIRNTDGKIIEMPKINAKRVKEISACLERNELISSTLTFNGRLMTADGSEELIYNERERSLTITQGTLLDILDGFHRLQAIVQTLSRKPDIDMNFTVRILNYDIPRAKMYFEQTNKTEPVAKSRLAEMNTSGFSNFIAKTVQMNSALRGKVSSSDIIGPYSEFLVTFRTLQEAIDSTFEIVDKSHAIAGAQYLTDFFDRLLSIDVEAFQTDIVSTKKESIINANQMFVGYVALAGRFYRDKIALTALDATLKKIDFNRGNPLWEQLAILDAKGNTRNMKKAIAKFFNQILIVQDGAVNG